ncbi:hypothetical protein DERP_006345 [Dermatophagoides pteronyssinus]|uniref:Uncharacterized protein n=1 Tax=Dermatophagoides pteronyssinus TaxID=6956 RepID=A0ABQ8IY55_DERPT|nr:hypothetical protein DERP_006345 [Dermatophagoides pteronyssinus]
MANLMDNFNNNNQNKKKIRTIINNNNKQVIQLDYHGQHFSLTYNPCTRLQALLLLMIDD